MEKLAFMRACREGGAAIERALRELDRTLFARLYRECRRSIRDHDAAEDLVQEAFIKVWRHCASFRGDSELLPWIRVILRRTILDRLRKGEREVTLDDVQFEAATDAAAIANGGTATTDRAARQAEIQSVFDACWQEFRATSPTHAAVMGWIVEDGLSNAEIGELLGRTPGATREFISQCRKRARIHLARWHALAAADGADDTAGDVA